MIMLDCESYGSAIGSICQVYGINKDSAEAFLNRIDLEAEYKSRVIYEDSCDYLKTLFDKHFGPPKCQLESVAWFHLTRTNEKSDFSEGLLPLGKVIDRIWDTLDALLVTPSQKANLSEMRANGVLDEMFSLKVRDVFHHGPYAMLVRDAAFNASSLWNHDYLEVPEIIEDICNGYREQFGHSIYDVVTKGLAKCIVKFISTKTTGEHLLAPVLLYCCEFLRKEEFSPFANTCFDSEGVPVTRDQIVQVQFL